MTPADIAVITKVMGPVMREFTAKAIADATAPLLAANAVLEQRILELETKPEPAAGPPGPRGEKGEAGTGVSSLVVSADGRLMTHLTDGRSVDAGPLPRGQKGADGAKGEPGERGPMGPQGQSGERGLTGEPGDPGEPGARGEKGLDGKDGAIGPAGRDGIDGKDGAPGINGKDGAPGERGVPGEKGLDGLHGRDGRDGAPGAPGIAGEKGLDGKDGRDGINGKDGLDGLGFDDYDLVFDETHGWLFRLGQGERLKEWVLGLPFDAKVWTAGTTYPKGAGTTWDGHYWIALTQTSEPPGEASPAWRMAVRRGKTGREGKQGKEGRPGRDLTQMDPATGQKW